MHARIHRGTHQIGGTSIEFESEGRRILLDCGLPLDGDPSDPSLLPDVPGLRVSDPSLLGVVITHGHRDHWGVLPHAGGAPSIFMGEATEAILGAAEPFVPDTPRMKAAAHLVDGRALEVGPFTITPYLICHSAYDAYSVMVDAGGRRLFYSGDFRGHGRKENLFQRLLHSPPRNVDVLLMEGSTLGRLDPDQQFESETDIEERLYDVITSARTMTLVAASAQNIDRVVSIFRATRRAGRALVIDLYAAEILRATGRASIPQTSWPDVCLFTPHHQRVKVKEEGLFSLLDRHKAGRLYPEDPAAEPGRFVVLFRMSMFRDLLRAKCLIGAQAIWSQWEGYLKGEEGKKITDAMAAAGLPLQVIHTSGHASIPDLRKLAAAISPKALVPIHTFHPDQFASLFNNVVVRSDGEWWEV